MGMVHLEAQSRSRAVQKSVLQSRPLLTCTWRWTSGWELARPKALSCRTASACCVTSPSAAAICSGLGGGSEKSSSPPPALPARNYNSRQQQHITMAKLHTPHCNQDRQPEKCLVVLSVVAWCQLTATCRHLHNQQAASVTAASRL